MIREKKVGSLPGGLMLTALVLLLVLSIYWLLQAARAGNAMGILGAATVLVIVSIAFNGLFVVYPNDAKIVTLFGSYLGTQRDAGFWWVNPFTSKRRLSMRVRNFESAKLKVNDHDGNPIEIAAVVVWKVVDSAEAMFEVDHYEQFVSVQTEAAVRNLATSHPYDSHQDGQMSLRANIAEVAEQLKQEIQARLDRAGVQVIESRISHLAYAPEIASAMLRRQQASAIVAARAKYVEGAVGMMEMALESIAAKGIVHLDDERKASMVTNMLVVLCSEQAAQPVINAGTLYH